MKRSTAQLLLALAGLAAVLWAVVGSANPTIVCRDEVMRPGQVCANAQGSKVQTYEERYAAAQGARPVIGVVGLLVIGFAAALQFTGGHPAAPLAAERDAHGPTQATDQDSSDIGP